jgi:hypothetical protein
LINAFPLHHPRLALAGYSGRFVRPGDAMKSPQETIAYLVEVITDIYEHPEMYAETPSELHSQLLRCHAIWGYITEREQEITLVHSQLCIENMQFVIKPDWFYDRVNNSDLGPFQSTIDFWRTVDKKLGIKAV